MRWERAVWAGFVVVGLLLLDALDPVWYGVVVPAAAAVVAWAVRRGAAPGQRPRSPAVDRRDMVVLFGLYAVIVVLFRLAFVGFGTGRVAGLFLTFAAGLVVGVAGPVWYTVWRRGRSMADLGLGGHWRGAAVFGVLLAAVQYSLTLWRQPLPADAQDWVPLLVMSLTVGLFETVFFRGFAQRRLEASVGRPLGIAAAAAMYALYHVGYGMGGRELVFLFGLGVVYALAFAVAEHAIVLWPLLTPLGAFYNNLRSGDVELPWAAIAGFADVLLVMALAIWWGHRRQRQRQGQRFGGGTSTPQAPAPAQAGSKPALLGSSLDPGPSEHGGRR